MVGKTRNIALQLVLQQCCKTSCTFFVARFSVPLLGGKLTLSDYAFSDLTRLVTVLVRRISLTCHETDSKYFTFLNHVQVQVKFTV